MDITHPGTKLSIRLLDSTAYAPTKLMPLLRQIHGLTWCVTNNGNVEYRRATNELVFVDKGNKLTFERKTVDDDDLAVTVLHA